MSSYSTFINDIYAVLSGDYADHFLAIDEVLEEVPASSDFVIRPSFNFGTSVSYTNLRDYEDDLIINLQIFRNHDSNVDIVAIGEDIYLKLKDLQSFVYVGWKFSIRNINLLKNFDTRYTGVTVQLISRKLEQVEEEPIDWSTRPLTFIAAEPNTKITIRRYGDIVVNPPQYKFNIDDEWQNYTPGDEISLEKVGDMVMFRSLRTTFSMSASNYFNIECSNGKFYARGQLNSLTANGMPYNYSFYRLFENNDGILSTPLFPSGTLVSHVYDSMFKGCSNLLEAESLIVPSQINDSHCINMFNGCTSLKDVKKIVFNSIGASTCYSMFQNCVSLKTIDITFPETTSANSQRAMFYNCVSLTKAPELPAHTLLAYCYQDMFNGCTSLTKAPKLPATTIATASYQNMFRGCINLKEASELNFTTINGNSNCFAMFLGCAKLEKGPSALLPEILSSATYESMFQDCSLLKTAPIIHATSLDSRSLYNMFQSCSKINEIEVHFTSWDPSNATTNWLTYANASGTFICHNTLPLTPRDNSHIPATWNVQFIEPYKRELDYLESTTSGEFIDTGIEFDKDYNFKMEVETSYVGNWRGIIIGNYNAGQQSMNLEWTVGTGGRAYVSLTSNVYNKYANGLDNTKHKFSLDYIAETKHCIFKIDDNVIADDIVPELTGSNFTQKGAIRLFLDRRQSTSEIRHPIRIYSSKIWKDDLLMRDFIPVMGNEDEPGMYDQVSKDIFYNDGGGNFNYGEIN